MKNTILKWVLLIALLAYTACITVWAGHQAQSLTCRGMDIIVKDAGSVTIDSITRSGVNEALTKYKTKIVGKPIYAIDTRALEKYLYGLKNLEDVHCVITADRRVEICVRPMVPEYRLITGQKSWYVNKDGKMVECRPEFFTEVPVVAAKFTKTFTPKSLLSLTRFIRQDAEMSQLAAMIVAKNPDNILIVPRITGHIINFGDTTDLLKKKENLLAFYKKVMPYKGWQTYDTISLKYKNQIVASRRDKTIANHATDLGEVNDPEEAALHDIEAVDAGAETTKKKPEETQTQTN